MPKNSKSSFVFLNFEEASDETGLPVWLLRKMTCGTDGCRPSTHRVRAAEPSSSSKTSTS